MIFLQDTFISYITPPPLKNIFFIETRKKIYCVLQIAVYVHLSTLIFFLDYSEVFTEFIRASALEAGT